MIESLILGNFKPWRDQTVKLNKLTGFFGTNSSGKTSIIQLLLLLKQTTRSSDRSQILNFGDDSSYVDLGTFSDVVFNHNVTLPLELGMSWTLEEDLKVTDPEKPSNELFRDDRLEFSTTIRQTRSGRLFVESLQYTFSGYQFSLNKAQKSGFQYNLDVSKLNQSNPNFKFTRTQGRVWLLPHPVKCYGFPDQVNAYFQNTGFLSDLQLQFETLLGNVYYLGPLREYPKRQYIWAGANPSDMGRRGEQVIDAMLASKVREQKISRGTGKPKFTVEEYVAYWLKKLNLIYSFRIHRLVRGGNLYRVMVKKTESSSEVLITDVGFGVSQILPVVTLCYYAPKGSTLIIEQPEIHLHPSVQAGLADIFIDAIKVKNIQIILESHSEYLLKRLQRRIAEGKFDSDHTSLYFCEWSRKGSILKNLELDEFGNIKNWTKHFFADDLTEIAATVKAIMSRKKKSKDV